MTPQVAESITIHEPDVVERPARRRLPAGRGELAAAARARRLRIFGDAPPQPGVSAQRRQAIRRRTLALADVLAASISLWLVLTLPASNDQPALLLVLAGMPIVVLVFKIAGLYDRDQHRLGRTTLEEVPLLLQLTGLYVLSVVILQSLIVTSGQLGGDQILVLWVVAFVGIVGGRVVARWLADRTTPLERCLVIGERHRADRVREKLATSRTRAAVIATFPLEMGGDVQPIALGDLRWIVRDLNVHRIIIVPTTADAEGIVHMIRVAKAAGVQVSVLPRMLEVVGSEVEFEDLDGMPMLGVRPFGLSRSSHLLKRAFDVIATSLGLLAVAPVIAAIMVAIRLDSRGPMFFRQVRIGRDGKPFDIVKFRSMVDGADAQKDDLLDMNEVGDGMFKIADDPRVTRVGKILRRTSLDELPQLFNVLSGEMSLVGPRPLVADEDAQVMGLDRARLHLTPGMTGPWQVLGARVPMQEMVGIDYHYVASWSLWLDVKLLLRTVRHVLRRGNV